MKVNQVNIPKTWTIKVVYGKNAGVLPFGQNCEVQYDTAASFLRTLLKRLHSALNKLINPL